MGTSWWHLAHPVTTLTPSRYLCCRETLDLLILSLLSLSLSSHFLLITFCLNAVEKLCTSPLPLPAFCVSNSSEQTTHSVVLALLPLFLHFFPSLTLSVPLDEELPLRALASQKNSNLCGSTKNEIKYAKKKYRLYSVAPTSGSA